jgi:hypothetical protein
LNGADAKQRLCGENQPKESVENQCKTESHGRSFESAMKRDTEQVRRCLDGASEDIVKEYLEK